MSLERETPNPELELARLTKAARPLETDALAARVRERLEAGVAPKFLRPTMRPRKAVWAGIGGAVALAVVLAGWVVRTSNEAAKTSNEETAPRLSSVPVTDGASEESSAPERSEGREAEASSPREGEATTASREAKTARASAANRSSLANVPVHNLLYEAARSLRGNGDAREALRLLDELARRSAASASSEEVLALRIEASGKLGSGKTKAYAERYLALYPNGKYRRLAESALGSAAK